MRSSGPTSFARIWLTGLLLASAVPVTAASADLSPLQAIERLQRATLEADAATAGTLLYAQYHGVSLQGPRQQRHVYVENRAKAVSDIAKLRPGEWEIRFLKTSSQVDSNGMAHVWARYVFYYQGVANHRGYESYGLLRVGGGWKIVSFADTDNALKGHTVEDVCPDQ